MDLRLLYAVFLSVLPIAELRGGLPLAILWANDSNVPVFLVFFLILLLNILVIFFIFYFLDNLHHVFLKIKIYNRIFEKYMTRFQKKINVFEKKYKTLGFLALILFVAVPLPGTGAWTGCLLSWVVNLDRKKSVLAIALGVSIAGILILLGTLGLINVFS